MKEKKFGTVVGICLLAASILLTFNSPVRAQDRPGLMIYGDVDAQPMGVDNNVYPNASDSGAIRKVVAGLIPDQSYGWRGIMWDTGSNGDVNGDDVVNVIDATLITRYAVFIESTFANSPTTLVPVSVTVYNGDSQVIPGNTATMMPGEKADLLLEVRNTTGGLVANALLQYVLSAAPPGVTMNGLGVGVPTDLWSDNTMIDPETRGPEFGQITVTVSTDLTTPSGTTRVDIICPGITALSPFIPILGQRPGGVAALDPVFFELTIGAPEVTITMPTDGSLISTSVTDVTVTTTAAVGNSIYLRIDGVDHPEIFHVVDNADWVAEKEWYEFIIPNVDLWATTPGDHWVQLIAVIEATGAMSNIVNIYTEL